MTHHASLTNLFDDAVQPLGDLVIAQVAVVIGADTKGAP
jgi:hypothetical protein